MGRGLLVGSGKEVSARGAEEEADKYHVLWCSRIEIVVGLLRSEVTEETLSHSR